MSELILLVARGGRLTEDCGRLVRAYRLYRLSRISPCYRADEFLSNLPCPVSTSRYLTWWSSMRGVFILPQKHASASVPLSSDIRGDSWKAVSTVTKHEFSDIPANDWDFKAHRTAELSLCLQRLLGIDAEEAELCLKNHCKFAVKTTTDIEESYKACRDAGISPETVKQNLEILLDPRRILEAKIHAIRVMNIARIDDAVPLFKLSVPRLQAFAQKIKWETIENRGKNSLNYLTEQLQCPMLTICQIMAKHYFMRTLPFSKLCQVLKIMLDSHVSRNDILSDVWALRYNPVVITERMNRVTNAGVFPVKPWMIRCPEIGLTKRIGKEIHRRSILGDRGTIVDYLSQRFEADKKAVTALVDKEPEIAQVSGPKIKQVVDFLLENGYTLEHVTRAPRVLFRSVETLQERLNELKKYNHKPETLAVFSKSKQQYDIFLEKVKLRWLLANCKK